MGLPIVAIVGRPNVGKSSLLNCLAGRRVSIVDEVAGVTRDRVSATVPLGEGYIELMDTGGYLDLSGQQSDKIAKDIVGQIEQAMAEADLILFVLDAREGVTTLDRMVAQRLRQQQKPVLLVANKIDIAGTAGTVGEVGEMAALGFGDALPISAIHRHGRGELLEAIAQRLGPVGEKPPEPVMKLAIVGRRNVGKSTFVNALAKQERVIVSEIPGTTRDNIDVRFEIDGQSVLIIDTAGVRKRGKLADVIEFYSQHRAILSIRRADVVLLLIDATEPVGLLEKQLAGFLGEEFKPVVLVVNKWDLARGKTDEDAFGAYLEKVLAQVAYAPLVFVCAKDGVGVEQVVRVARQLYQQVLHRVTTSELNRVMEEVVARHSPPAGQGARVVRLYYASQIATQPPTIVCFVNDVSAFTPMYQRFLAGRLRERLPFSEVPIRLLFRLRARRPQRPKPDTEGKKRR